jgi:Arc/MetJ-type ribon-helix-helix transcriptional regulator
MATLNIDLPDAMKEFVNTKVGPGRFKDASAFLQLLIAEAMEAQADDFTAEQRERIDQMLLQSTDSFDRGEYAPLRPGEFEELAKRVIARHQGKSACNGREDNHDQHYR